MTPLGKARDKLRQAQGERILAFLIPARAELVEARVQKVG